MSNPYGITFGLLFAALGFYAIGAAARLVREFNEEVCNRHSDSRAGRKLMREMALGLCIFGSVFVGLGTIVLLDLKLQIPMVALLWCLIVVGAVGSCVLGAHLVVMRFLSRLSHSHAVVQSVSLEESGGRAQSFSVIVRLESECGPDEFAVQLWGSDRKRAERSARYRKVIDFYVPGRRILVYRARVLGFIPEMPVLPIGIVVPFAVLLIGLTVGVIGLNM